MEEDVRVNQESSYNPCCQLWIEKYTKLKERHSKLEDARNALRKGLTIFEQQIAKIQSENLSLKKAYEGERARAESEKEDKLKESARRITLENEVATMKSEILLLQENGDLATKGVDEEVGNLRRRVSEAESEINLLKELLEEEKKRVDAEKEKVEMERKRAQDAMRKVKAENKKASEEKRLANTERKKAEELRLRLETLECEADEAKSKLALETARYEQDNKKLKAERESTTKNKNRADTEMAKAAEQRKLAEENWRKAMDEKNRADELSQQLDRNKQRLVELEKQIHILESTRKVVENSAQQSMHGHEELAGDIFSVTMKSENGSLETRKKLEEMELKIIREKKQAKSVMKKAKEQRKIAETYKRKAIEEKHRADVLSRELELKKQRLEDVQKEIQELVSSRKVAESPHPASGGSLKAETAEINLLRKQLKFEKARVKHAKEVAKLEVSWNYILRHEVHRLKQEIIQFSQRLGMLDDSLFHKYEGRNKLEKKGSLNLGQGHFHLEPSELILHNENDFVKQPSSTTSAAIGGTAALKPNQKCTVLLPPTSGEIQTSPTGTDSNLELLLRGSNRKMLQSYAINSSSASFSDRPLVGSQERGMSSVTTSAKLAEEQNLEPTASRLSGDTRKTYDEKLATGAENSVGSPIKSGATERNGSHRKKKRLPDTVESIEHLYSGGKKRPLQILQKLSVLHGTLDGESPKSLEEERLLLEGNMCNKLVRPHKKQKESAGDSMAIHKLYDPSEPKIMTRILGVEGCDVCKHTSVTECNVIQTSPVLNDGMDGLLASKLHLPRISEEVFGHDYMKLVDLDNATDESRFRKAIEKPISPLSPMLCNIKFSSSETSKIEMATSMPLADESMHVDFSKAEENVVPSCSFDVVKLEIDSNKRTLKNLGASKILSLGMTEPPNDSCENLGNNEGDDLDFVSGQMQNTSTLYAASRNEDIKISCKRRDSLNWSLKYCAILSNNSDSSTISKIFYVSSNCMSQCSTNTSLKFLIQNILLSLQKADDLSAEGRVSVFFSLLLHYISEITNGDFGNYSDCDSLQFIDSFGQQMRAVLNDDDIRRVFVESCDMHELVALIEDLLLNRRILACDVSHGLALQFDSRGKVNLDSNCIFWSIQAASTDLLFAAGLILGSICAAVDQIGFVCEVSCNIFSMKTINSLLLLRLLHTFAYLCGTKFFTIEGYGLVMSVLKCLVVFFEGQNSSRDCFYCLPTVVGACMKNSAHGTCPFSDGAVSVDIIVSVLLEKLQNYALSGKQDLMDALHSSHCSSIKDVQYPPNFVSNQYLCHFIDILSLVELVASFMSWDWIFGNVISRLLQMLDACVQQNFFPAIITLLGQFGRLGVYAKGYEDLGVEDVRKWLCGFLGKSMFRNFGLPVQFASVCALVGLISRPLEEIVENNFSIPTAGSQSLAMDRVRKWFSSLRKEQQSSFKSLQSLQASSKCVSIGGNHAFNDTV